MQMVLLYGILKEMIFIIRENPNEELPVTMKVTYYLDGQQMDPKDMAGKSGEVKIRFDYYNNSNETVK